MWIGHRYQHPQRLRRELLIPSSGNQISDIYSNEDNINSFSIILEIQNYHKTPINIIKHGGHQHRMDINMVIAG